MSEDKWVRVMSDFCCNPLWAREGGMMDWTDLPVSKQLKVELSEWQEWYDRDGEARPCNNKTNFDLEGFAKKGLELAQTIKRELPDWTVIFFDDYTCALAYEREQNKGVKRDRKEYEFEIPVQEPIKVWRYEFDNYGGYDCMYAGFIVYDEHGEKVLMIDVNDFTHLEPKSDNVSSYDWEHRRSPAAEKLAQAICERCSDVLKSGE